jgi:predicted secreted protein
MTRCAAAAASVRRGAEAALAALLIGLAGPASAGDRALLEVVGYSGDGRYFAFEEYGIQDGSGFPYSNIFVVDLATDSWVAGTPFRYRVDDESVPLFGVRAENRAEAGPTIARLDIGVPAQMAAMVGDGALDPAADMLEFGLPGYGPGHTIGRYGLELETFPVNSLEPCEVYLDEKAKGYALTLYGDGPARELHRDGATIPRSRGCPVTYRLHAVTVPMHQTALDSAVAIVSVYPHGFEGPDRRFIAVPIGAR